MKTFAALCLLLFSSSLLASGTLDNTFADEGVLVMRFDEASADGEDIHDFAIDGLVDQQGRYVSVGYAYDSDHEYGFFGQITRHLPSGERDLGMAGQGFLRFRNSPQWATKFKTVAEHNGKLIVGGEADSGDELMNPHTSVLVCRFDESGEPDPAFGATAASDHPGCRTYGELFPSTNSFVIDMQVLGDGKILLLIARESGGSSYGLARLTADGEPDPTFGDGNCPQCGYVLSPASLGNFVKPVALSADEARGILVAGHFSVAGNQDMAVIFHKIDGGIETGFSVDGMLSVGFDDIFEFQTNETGGTSDLPAGIGFAGDGSVLIGGTATPKGVAPGDPDRYTRIAVAKFDPDGEVDASFGNTPEAEGKFISMYNYSTGSYANSFAIQANGKIILAGRCGGCKGSDFKEQFVVARVMADGSSLDKSWAHPEFIYDSTMIDIGDSDSYIDGAYSLFNGSSAIALDKNSVVVFGWNKNADPLGNTINPHIVKLELDNMFSDGFDF